jgi:predicted transcriptional regulator
VLSDRDVVVEVIAEGKDPTATKLRDLLHGEAVTIDADDSAEEAIRTTQDHQVRRLPVIDGTQLVGMISQAEIAWSCHRSRSDDWSQPSAPIRSSAAGKAVAWRGRWRYARTPSTTPGSSSQVAPSCV